MEITALVDKISQLQLVGSFEDAESASEFMLDKTVDLAFLDIQMAGINGIDFAKKYPEPLLLYSLLHILNMRSIVTMLMLSIIW